MGMLNIKHKKKSPSAGWNIFPDPIKSAITDTMSYIHEDKQMFL